MPETLVQFSEASPAVTVGLPGWLLVTQFLGVEPGVVGAN